jgi:putative PIN family toxin of toxin-antitoxin system
MKAVLDVGQFVSATINPHGHPGQILTAWRNDQFELVTASAILEDLRRVLGYPRIRKRHGWSDEQIDWFVQLLAAAATVTPGRHTVQVVAADPTDDKILACAEEGRVDYIVASDEQHLVPLGSYAGIPIVRPRQFLEILAQHSGKP